MLRNMFLSTNTPAEPAVRRAKLPDTTSRPPGTFRRIGAFAVAAMVLLLIGLAVLVSGRPASAAVDCSWQSPKQYISNFEVVARSAFAKRGQPHSRCPRPSASVEQGKTYVVIAKTTNSSSEVWYYIKNPDNTGYAWVRSDAFAARGGDVNSPTPAKQGKNVCTRSTPVSYVPNYQVTAAKAFNKRAEPYRSCASRGTLSVGRTYTVIGEEKKADGYTWFFVKNSKTAGYGWVRSDAFNVGPAPSNGSTPFFRGGETTVVLEYRVGSCSLTVAVGASYGYGEVFVINKSTSCKAGTMRISLEYENFHHQDAYCTPVRSKNRQGRCTKSCPAGQAYCRIDFDDDFNIGDLVVPYIVGFSIHVEDSATGGVLATRESFSLNTGYVVGLKSDFVADPCIVEIGTAQSRKTRSGASAYSSVLNARAVSGCSKIRLTLKYATRNGSFETYDCGADFKKIVRKNQLETCDLFMGEHIAAKVDAVEAERGTVISTGWIG